VIAINKIMPIYDQIKSYLMSLITQNSKVESYKLPSENQLALKFKSSRMPAVRALKALEDEGLIIRHKGRGSYINYENADSLLKKKHIRFIVSDSASLLSTELINGICDFCSDNDINFTTAFSKNDVEKESEVLKYAANDGCNGILLYPVDNDFYSNDILNLVTTAFPVVLVDRKLHGLNLSCVSGNHFSQGYNAAKCLIEKGHKDIGFISMPLTYASSVYDRYSGYEKAMIEKFGSKGVTSTLQTPYADRTVAQKAIYDYLDSNHFTAIITNNGVASGLIYKYVIDKNLTIPDDIALMLFDNEFKELEYLIHGTPYYIDQNAYTIGYRAAELLLKLIENAAEIQNILIEESIVDY